MRTGKVLIIGIWMLCFLLTGCNADTASTQIHDPITVSGDTAYYAAMDQAERKAIQQKHIAVSGTVFSNGYTTFYIGDPAVDGISISCTFSEHSKALASIRAGDRITLHGICTGVIGNYLYLDHCQLSEHTETQPTTAAPTTDAVTRPTTGATAAPTTDPATTPATEPTAPVIPPATQPTAEPTTPPATEPTSPTVTQPTTGPTTAPTTEPTTTPTTESVTEPSGSGIVFLKWPETVSRNETAEVTIQGKPNTQYSITVYYKSGPSSAKGLEPQTSDSSGYVTWTWKVGGKTAVGTFRIVVTGGGEENTVHFTVQTE